MATFSRRSFIQSGTSAAAAFWTGIHAQRSQTHERIAAVHPMDGHGAQVRDAYSLDPHITYLNHGSIGTIPSAVQDAHIAYLRLCEANPWLYMWSAPWQEARDDVRRSIAAVLGCQATEVVFTHNTTEGFNLLAQGLPLGTGDEVLFSSLNHSGASVCWEHHGSRRGYTVRRFPFPMHDVPTLSAADIVALHVEQITDATTVLVLPHIDNIVGLRHPVRAIADAARARGVRYVAVDGAQAIGMIPVDLATLGVDFYANSPHKWLQAPKGTGLLYVREAVHAEVEPMWVTWGQRSWAGSARTLEDYGTRNLAAVLTLSDAAAFQRQLGLSEAVEYRRSLWEYLHTRVAATPGLTWASPSTWALGSSLYAIGVPEDSRALFERLYTDHGLVFRAFHGDDWNTIRLSPNTLNTHEELDRLLALLGA